MAKGSLSQSVSRVVFPVAGLGTRFLPATKTVPKEMLPVVDRPLIQWVVEEAAAAGCREFIFVTSKEKASICAHFSAAPHYEDTLKARGKVKELSLLKAGLPEDAKIIEVHQDAPLGLGHAIWCARAHTKGEPFAVILPDDLILSEQGCLSQMISHYHGGTMIALETVPAQDTNKYGIVAPESEAENIVKIADIVEKPEPDIAPSNLGVVGRYILDGGIMDILETQKAGAGGEIQLTDAIAQMIPTTMTSGYRFTGERYDCGSREGFLAANLAYALSPYGANMGTQTQTMLNNIINPKPEQS